MKYIIIFVFILFSNSVCAQRIHHQMISSQGNTSTTNSGQIVKQTVGQLSVIGNNKKSIQVQQGYQQVHWAVHLAKPKNIAITCYPNPFTQFINFNVSNSTKIMVEIFDINGKLVFYENYTVENKLLRIELSRLASGTYLVKLNIKGKNYFTKILKN